MPAAGTYFSEWCAFPKARVRPSKVGHFLECAARGNRGFLLLWNDHERRPDGNRGGLLDKLPNEYWAFYFRGDDLGEAHVDEQK